MPLTQMQLAQRVADAYAALPLVRAVAVGGSTALGAAEPGSDIDTYIYVERAIPVADRIAIAEPYLAHEFDLNFWETTDNYVNAETGYALDILYRWVTWAEAEIDRIFVTPVGWLGYTTAIWHNFRTAIPLFDRDGWFAGIQERARQPYPEALRTAIIEKNAWVMRRTLFSYTQQIEKAVRRGDLISLNHRIAALLASYFDILFALNYVPHPGEKRQLTYAESLCPLRPDDMRADIEQLLRLSGTGDGETISAVHRLQDRLSTLLMAHGFPAV